jgi:thiamine-monophosphate kinase
VTEDGFLRGLFPRLGTMPPEVVVPPGDDCAAVRIAPGRLQLLAVDQLIGDRHYHRTGPGAASPELAGRKLLARNLSDIAAMGGEPRYALVAVALDPRQDVAWLNRFFDGLLELARATGTHLIGGDLARAPHDAVASLTIVGEVAEAQIKRRSDAKAGDLLLATGRFGSSLETGHHLTFTPRLAEGAWLAARPAVHAMMDVSDGLLLDSRRLGRAASLDLRLDPAAVPRRTPETTLRQALADGEDYELILAADPAAVPELLADWPFADLPLTVIGEFTAPSGATPEVRRPDGTPLHAGQDGFDHLARPAGKNAPTAEPEAGNEP